MLLSAQMRIANFDNLKLHYIHVKLEVSVDNYITLKF